MKMFKNILLAGFGHKLKKQILTKRPWIRVEMVHIVFGSCSNFIL